MSISSRGTFSRWWRQAVVCCAAMLTSSTSVGLADDNKQSAEWDMLTAKPEVVEAWQDMRFGMFVSLGPVNAVDGDPRTCWQSNPGIKQGWLEVDLGEPCTFDRAWLHEPSRLEPHDHIQKFELQAKQGDAWQTFHSGTTIGKDHGIQFPPVTARHVRLQILDTTGNPLISEFQLFRSEVPRLSPPATGKKPLP